MTTYRILIVDDDDTHLLATSGILAADGHDVRTHRGPFGVTGRLVRESPDVVLLDVNMPALSGEGLARLLRDRAGGRAAILLHSSNDEAALREIAERLGLDGHVCKGDPAVLRAAVAQHGARVRATAGCPAPPPRS